MVKQTLFQDPIDFASDTAILAIDEIIEPGAVCQGHAEEIAQGVIIVVGRAAGVAFGEQFAVGGVGVGGITVGNQTVLFVVDSGFRDGTIDPRQAVAVGVIGVGGFDLAILFDFQKTASRVVGVLVQAGLTSDGLGFLGDPPQFVTHVKEAE
ncbi:MAG: hypothetical protein H7833_01160 [Magnetococcus sp. DMHC-1]